jgi:hypothetical protein
MMQSAGSRWNSPGSLVLRTAIAGSSGAELDPRQRERDVDPPLDGAVELDPPLRAEHRDPPRR